MDNYITYKGIPLQQNPNTFNVFKAFLEQQNFTHILEIGTGCGGFTLFLKDTLPSAEILTYDVGDRGGYNLLLTTGVRARIGNAFNEDINNIDYDFCGKRVNADEADKIKSPVVTDNELLDFLKQPGKKLILCDGGHKIGEFRCLAEYLTPGDFIMAHDYAESLELFETDIKGKYWDWCEIEEKYITKACKENNLKFYNQNTFKQIGWVCKIKLF